MKKYINIYKDNLDYFVDEKLYDTPEQAKEWGEAAQKMSSVNYHKTIEIEL